MLYAIEILPHVSLPRLYEPIATHSAPAAATVMTAAAAAARKQHLQSALLHVNDCIGGSFAQRYMQVLRAAS
jgi:hypothetical protein